MSVATTFSKQELDKAIAAIDSGKQIAEAYLSYESGGG